MPVAGRAARDGPVTGHADGPPVLADLDAIRAEWCAVGAGEDFFAAGGDSLKAIDVADRIRRRLAVALEYIDLFDHPTPGALAAHVACLREREDGCP
jgi:aryl carrier-like protein